MLVPPKGAFFMKMNYRFQSIAIIAAIGIFVPWAGLVWGHPRVTASNIANGAVLAAADLPESVQVQFNEEIDHKRSSIYVYRMGSDSLVDLGDVRVSQDTLSVSLRPSLGSGVYQIRWIAISPEDAGYREDTITFSVK